MLYCSNTNDSTWFSNRSPRLNIYGYFDVSDTLSFPVIKGGTIKYKYDDVKHTVEVFSIRNTLTNDRSKIKYSIDRLGNVGQKSIYTSDSDSNTYRYLFNFLNQPARTFDALNDSTMFSYDGLGRPVKTKNSDTSSTENAYAYYDNMSEYFGTSYSGFIEKQTFEDEEGNQFEKYYDAAGNLRRERKFVEGSTVGEDPPGFLTTDYWYDSLYRVTKVKTPQGKTIYYSYDGYSRQASRTTPDAGLTKYLYDKNNNLLYSQDAVQRNTGSDVYTFRTYDGLNRITSLGVTTLASGAVQFDSIKVDSSYSDIESDNPSSNYYLTINAYDTITNSVIGIFTGVNGYAGENFTLSHLAATAYRTRLTDAWNFKYYRYDARGRVTKMWNIIEGFDTLITEYQYNSQDQITMYSHYGNGSPQTFRNSFDYAGRLNNVEFYAGAPDAPNPEYITLTEYSYNENSQVSQQKLNNSGVKTNYYYNNRQWVMEMQESGGLFDFTNDYYKNGNVKSQEILGSYKENFDNTTDLNLTYTYDKSNRLLETENANQEYKDNFKLENKYDKDGNIIELKRYDGDGSLADNFNYTYYSNTNKLQRATGSGTQYTYDANGNMLTDDVNRNKDIKYDYRNLIIQLRHKKIVLEDSLVYLTYYYYDESGNRIRKRVYQYIGIQPSDSVESPDEEDIGDAPGTWELIGDELYSRGVDGKELAIYVNGNIKQTNIWGLGHEGYITTSDAPNFYLKDHLGSIRIVTNENDEVISAQDYDCWGYLLEGRTYESDESVYKFTGKQKDGENLYDYFGARYYDARIGRWGSVEPLLDKYPSISPYDYSLNNPLRIIDPNGLDPFEIIVRTYIPFDVVTPGFKGDSRGADPNTTSFRTEQRITVETDRTVSSTIIQNYDASLSPSVLYLPSSPIPTMVGGLGEGNFSAVASYSSDINEGNNTTVELSGEAHVGIIPSALSPAIDYSFGITILPQKDGSVQVLLTGSHDNFPAYEIYLKDKSGKSTLVYSESPNDPVFGVRKLFPFYESQKLESQITIP